jgi:hypothetical protein
MTYITYSRLVKSLKICLFKQRDLGRSTNTFLLKLNENYRLFKIICLPFLRLLKLTRIQTWTGWLARKLYTQILCSITLAGDSEKYRRSFPVQ